MTNDIEMYYSILNDLLNDPDAIKAAGELVSAYNTVGGAA